MATVARTPVEQLVDHWVRAWGRTIRLRQRDLLAPLTWEQWQAWQAWAVCGCERTVLRRALIEEAQSALLLSLMRGDLREPKRDHRVPVLREGLLIATLDDEPLRLWLNYHVRGRSLAWLAERHGMTVHALHQRIANARVTVASLLPVEALGFDVACGQTRLTLW